MRAPASPPPLHQDGRPAEDKRLERLYDYTKFHIGIYLSAAGGIAALLASKDADWIISKFVGNHTLLYLAFVFLFIAGMCGGMVATSITESLTFDEFWIKDHHPGKLQSLKATGKTWVHREHRFFWLSLLALAAALLVRHPWPFAKEEVIKGSTETTCCCPCQPQKFDSTPTK
jgi:hypothetical protein